MSDELNVVQEELTENIEEHIVITFNNMYSGVMSHTAAQVKSFEDTVDVEDLLAHLKQYCSSLFIYAIPETFREEFLQDMKPYFDIDRILKLNNGNIYITYWYYVSDEEIPHEALCVFENGAQVFRFAEPEEYQDQETADQLDVKTSHKEWLKEVAPDRFLMLKRWIEETGTSDSTALDKSPYAEYIDELTQAALDGAKKLGNLSIKIKKDTTSGDYRITFYNNETGEEVSWTFDTAKDKLLSLIRKYASEAEVKADQIKDYLSALKEKLNRR